MMIVPLTMHGTVLLGVALSFAVVPECPPEHSASDLSSSKRSENSEEEESNMTATILIPLVSAILGGLAGAGIAILYSMRQAKQEYRSLILAFCSELVSAFDRCVMYERLEKERSVSYSTLFDFTDCSALSKLASVCQDWEKGVGSLFWEKTADPNGPFFASFFRHFHTCLIADHR